MNEPSCTEIILFSLLTNVSVPDTVNVTVLPDAAEVTLNSFLVLIKLSLFGSSLTAS